MAATVSVTANEGSQIATVTGSALTDQFDPVLALAADILLNPSFPEKELALYKVRARASLEEQRSDPDFLKEERYAKAIYGTHPASSMGLTRESLEKVTRESLVGFHKANYVPDHTIIGVSGDITLAEARTKFEGALKGWAKSGKARPGVVDPPDPGAMKVIAGESAGFGADRLPARRAGDQSRASRLRSAAGDEHDPGRLQRPAVPGAPRVEGLHLRGVQRRSSASLSRRLARVHGCAHGGHGRRRCGTCSASWRKCAIRWCRTMSSRMPSDP